MYNQLQISMGFVAYSETFKQLENKLIEYKKELASKLEIFIQHPAYQTEQKNVNKIQKLFPKEVEYFDNPTRFIIALTVLNYHIANINSLVDIFSFKDLNSMTFTLTIEEIHIIKSFSQDFFTDEN